MSISYAEEEYMAYREDPSYHDRGLGACRRCEDPVSDDEQVEGLCPDCMTSAGLVRCDGCGRAFAKEIAKVEKVEGFKPFHYCPFCAKGMK